MWENISPHLRIVVIFQPSICRLLACIYTCTVVCFAALFVLFMITILWINHSIPSFVLSTWFRYRESNWAQTTPIRDCSLQSLVSADVGECGWETHNQEAAQQGDDLWTDLVQVKQMRLSRVDWHAQWLEWPGCDALLNPAQPPVTRSTRPSWRFHGERTSQDGSIIKTSPLP